MVKNLNKVQEIESVDQHLNVNSKPNTSSSLLPNKVRNPLFVKLLTICNSLQVPTIHVSDSFKEKLANGIRTSISSNAATVISVTLLYPLEIVKTRA